MNEKALKTAREFQSNQTGFLHLYYSNEEIKSPQTIPIVENFLFVLVLFATKTQESMTEAKNLLANLLPFQSENGNFPIYIHEWPNCYDAYLPLNLILPMYRIHQEYLFLMKEDLRIQFEDSFNNLRNYCKNLDESLPYPYGTLLNNILGVFGDRVCFKDDENKPYGSHQIGLKMLIPLVDISDEANWWHPNFKQYIGPAFCEYQEQFVSKDTLFNVAMDNTEKMGVSKLCLYDALKKKSPNENFLPFIREGISFEHKWYIKSEEKFALSLIEQKRQFDKGFHPLRLIFEGKDRSHSFVFQGFKGTIDYKVDNNQVELICSLPPKFLEDDLDDREELSFFIDLHDDLIFLVESQKATTFTLGDHLVFSSTNFQIKMNISLLSGDGDFIGHIMRGNRPSQLRAKGDDKFSAYDLKIFLRTLRRSSDVKLSVKLEF